MTAEWKLRRCIARLDLCGFDRDGDAAEVRIEFRGSRVTSDGGLILVRELDERLGVSDLIAQLVSGGREYLSTCPLCDKPWHLYVSSTTGLYHCKHCDAKGNLPQLCAQIEGRPARRRRRTHDRDDPPLLRPYAVPDGFTEEAAYPYGPGREYPESR